MALWLYQLQDLAKISDHLHNMEARDFAQYLSVDGGLTVRDDDNEIIGWFTHSEDAWVFQESPSSAGIPITTNNE